MAFRVLKVIYLCDFRNFEIDSFADIRSIFQSCFNFNAQLHNVTSNGFTNMGNLLRIELVHFCTSSSKRINIR